MVHAAYDKALLVLDQVLIDGKAALDNKAMIDRAKNAALAKKIADSIAESGKSAKTIAAEVGVKPQAVTGWKTTGSIGKDTLIRLAQAVGKHPLYFMETDERSESIGDRIDHLSPGAQRLIREIIAAEERGTSSPKIIEALSKVLHVALPAPSATDRDTNRRLTRLIDEGTD